MFLVLSAAGPTIWKAITITTVEGYYSKGSLWERCEVKRWSRIWHGTHEVWWPNGQKAFYRELRNGEQIGPRAYWDEDGQEINDLEWTIMLTKVKRREAKKAGQLTEPDQRP